MDSEELYDASDKVTFSTVVNAILYEHFEIIAPKIYWFIEKNSESSANNNTDLINGINHYSPMRATKSFLDFIICKDQNRDISFYQSVTAYPIVLVKKITYQHFIYNSNDYFINKGIVKSGYETPDCQIYFSSSILNHIHKGNKETIINLDYITSKSGLDFEHIGRKIKSENYNVDSFEEFDADIIKKVCNIPDRFAKVFWEMYKNNTIKK